MLKTIATAQNQEVRLQNRMLETLEAKIGDVQDHMETINSRMKTTLEEASGLTAYVHMHICTHLR
jgi:molybdopterin-biosynthesis enzyme MoeA-like protein